MALWEIFLMHDQIQCASTTPQNLTHSLPFDVFPQLSCLPVIRRMVIARKRYHLMKKSALKSSLTCLLLVSWHLSFELVHHDATQLCNTSQVLANQSQRERKPVARLRILLRKQPNQLFASRPANNSKRCLILA
jgi:hypothetical protein